MNKTIRFILSLFSFLASYFFIYWVSYTLIPNEDGISYIHMILSFLSALTIAYLVWKNTGTLNVQIKYMLTSAMISGSVMFLLGFIGPMLLDPGANQGPMLGFVFGPFGFIMGFFGAGIAWNLKLKNAKENKSKHDSGD